ncbi:MAG TPA: helical backbone metal receptor [Mycobacteriales bacterium]|nr:helical backbone metal receptor [Mycobacteriales bacterium]
MADIADIARDDLGRAVPLPPRVERVVSLVPSLTESIALSAPGLLVGATDWCVEPVDLAVTRIGGTKNPSLGAIADLAPDVVVASRTENRDADLDALREAGLAVWVTKPRTVDEAAVSLHRMLTVALRLPRPAWLDDVVRVWSEPALPLTRTVVVPIWRKPWMFVGGRTFGGDVLARLGCANALDGHAEEWPRLALDDLPHHDAVVLPDEPYAFSATDGPEAFTGVPSAVVSGRHLFWDGPSLVDARRVLLEQLSVLGS